MRLKPSGYRACPVALLFPLLSFDLAISSAMDLFVIELPQPLFFRIKTRGPEGSTLVKRASHAQNSEVYPALAGRLKELSFTY
jgi:hypothetical protein